MSKVVGVVVTAVAGGLIGLGLKIPAGALIGAMVAVAVAKVTGVTSGELGTPYLIMAQIVLGAIIGSEFDGETLRVLKTAWASGLIIVTSLSLGSLAIGWVVAKITGLDLPTALFSSMPGGMSQITAAAEGMGADARLVATFHLVRLVVITAVVPFIAKWLTRGG